MCGVNTKDVCSIYNTVGQSGKHNAHVGLIQGNVGKSNESQGNYKGCDLLLVFLLLCHSLPLLPSLVETEQRRGAVHPLDEARPRPQGCHRVVTRMVLTLLIPDVST